MDADRFDAFVKALGLSAARRGMVSGLLGGGLASLLATLEGEARRRGNRHDGLSAEKRKKHKKKKHKKRKKEGSPGDEAPPCTDGKCPLPPGCSQQAVEDCAAAFIETAQAELEPCQPVCEAGDSPACRACVEPIALAHLPAAHACIAASCEFPVSWSEPEAARAVAVVRHRAQPLSERASAKAWWQRVCDKPTCCARNLETCEESARDTLTKCGVGALVATGRGGSAAGVAAVILCLGNYSYDTAACLARFGCRDGQCVEGDKCVCPEGGTQCGSQCCHWDQTCCGGKCCPEGQFEGDHYCCGDAEQGQCCPREASICAAGGGDRLPACCFPGDVPCSNGTCCRAGSHCCPTGGCCNDGDSCCFRESSNQHFCCPPNAQCMQTGIPCCSNC